MKFVTICTDILLLALFTALFPVPSRCTFSTFQFLASSSGHPKQNVTKKQQVKCGNGVCSLSPTLSKIEIRGGFDGAEEDKIKELQKLGWSKEDASRALAESENDVATAAQLLETEQDQIEEQRPLLIQLTKLGWNEEISKIALKENNGNLTAAMEMLENEEKTMLTNFENSVHDMINNGWDEVVARQALLAQWHLDKAKFNGENTTVPREVLDGIRPTLKKLNETQSSQKTQKKKQPEPGIKSKKGVETKRAEKEDVVFEVNANNLQKIVLDSDVPVLLDVYADWCGPCKQLGPMLEDAAMRAGGLFRLAKVNSDKERSVVECLQISGLPTVYAVVKGKLTDR